MKSSTPAPSPLPSRTSGQLPPTAPSPPVRRRNPRRQLPDHPLPADRRLPGHTGNPGPGRADGRHRDIPHLDGRYPLPQLLFQGRPPQHRLQRGPGPWLPEDPEGFVDGAAHLRRLLPAGGAAYKANDDNLRRYKRMNDIVKSRTERTKWFLARPFRDVYPLGALRDPRPGRMGPQRRADLERGLSALLRGIQPHPL